MHIARILPTVADLVALAVSDTDFLGDISPDQHDLVGAAAGAADLAAELWEEAHGYPLHGVPLELILRVRAELVDYANDLLQAEDEARADARYDAMMAGDLDRDGNVVPFPRYRSA